MCIGEIVGAHQLHHVATKRGGKFEHEFGTSCVDILFPSLLPSVGNSVPKVRGHETQTIHSCGVHLPHVGNVPLSCVHGYCDPQRGPGKKYVTFGWVFLGVHAGTANEF